MAALTFEKVSRMALARSFWNAGETVPAIAKALGQRTRTVSKWLKDTGVINPYDRKEQAKQ